MKKFLFLIILILLFPTNVFAGWEYKNETWYYPEKEGWIHEYGYDYYIKEDHSLNIDPLLQNNKIYYFNTENKSIPYGALVNKNQVKSIEKQFNDISYLEIKKENTNPTKVCVLLHSLGSSKEDLEGYGCELAYNGYLVLIPDEYAHGRDLNKGTFPEIIVNSSKYIDALLSNYNFNELNIMGCSMGGMVGSYYVCNGNYQVNNLCLLISTPVFSSLENDIFYYGYKSGNVNFSNDKNEIKNDFLSISPENDIRLKTTRLFMINTTSDQYIPYIGLEKIKNTIPGTYITVNNNGHTVTPDNFQAAIDFIINNPTT